LLQQGFPIPCACSPAEESKERETGSKADTCADRVALNPRRHLPCGLEQTFVEETAHDPTADANRNGHQQLFRLWRHHIDDAKTKQRFAAKIADSSCGSTDHQCGPDGGDGVVGGEFFEHEYSPQKGCVEASSQASATSNRHKLSFAETG